MAYHADYNKLYPVGDEFRLEANKVHAAILEVYEEIEKVHNTWHGNQYTMLVDMCNNKFLNYFNEQLLWLIADVPYVIEYDAIGYAAVDGLNGIFPDARQTPPEPIPAPKDFAGEVIDLSDEQASAEKRFQTKVSALFGTARQSLNNIQGIFDATRPIWDTPSGNDARRRFAETRSQLDADFNQISRIIDSQLSAAIQHFIANEENRKKDATNFGQ